MGYGTDGSFRTNKTFAVRSSPFPIYVYAFLSHSILHDRFVAVHVRRDIILPALYPYTKRTTEHDGAQWQLFRFQRLRPEETIVNEIRLSCQKGTGNKKKKQEQIN